MSQVAHQAEAYPGFCSMKWLGVFLLPLWCNIIKSITGLSPALGVIPHNTYTGMIVPSNEV